MSQNIPQHVAIIMDGNGRWAQKRNRPRYYGHVRGSFLLNSIIKEAKRIGVKALTVFAFSSENWSRPSFEREILWKLFRKLLKKEVKTFKANNIRLNIIGDVSLFSETIQDEIKQAEKELSQNDGFYFNIALSYGAHDEILSAAKKFATECQKGFRQPDDLDNALFEKNLWTAPLGDLTAVDLLIRTSGEKRISNFLLWQIAYAEIIFTDVLWPDFTVEEFQKSIREFSSRERRFGKIL